MDARDVTVVGWLYLYSRGPSSKLHLASVHDDVSLDSLCSSLPSWFVLVIGSSGGDEFVVSEHLLQD